tara:strand:+ start:310 stop:792 length:483 start_codon:yes stop_codon:yes gene_type:complete
MECVLNERRIKYDDGEVYWWYSHTRNRPLKNPRWIKFKQSICGSRKTYYKTMEVKGKKYKVHRVIYKIHNADWDIDDTSKTNEIDHIDKITFNNNINNLRVVTQQQNSFNRTFKGYSYDKRYNSYRVRITIDGESKSFTFKTEEEAIKKRAELKIKYHTI